MTMSFRDPSGLIDRAPELAALAERAPALRRAIEKGLPHDAYRALYWAHKRGRFGDLGSVADTLLAHRRLFLKPLNGAPAMITFNGVGASLYGSADADANDGTYVATLFFVFVFVPVFPIASYLVRDASKGGRRAWSFIAKVPLGTFTYLWQRACGLAMLGLVAFGAISAIEGYGHQSVHVVNALGVPVMVTLSGASAKEVPSGTRLELRTTTGPHTITTTLDGRAVETESLDAEATKSSCGTSSARRRSTRVTSTTATSTPSAHRRANAPTFFAASARSRAPTSTTCSPPHRHRFPRRRAAVTRR